jgi:hypothetical protein
MKVRTSLEHIAGRWVAQVSLYDPDPFTALEAEKLQQAGSPLVDVGGSFSGSLTRPGDMNPTSVTFSLPETHLRLPEDFPVKRTFDPADVSDADVQALLWLQTVTTRMAAARDTLLAVNTAATSETVSTL